jgi:hypothetical protein
MKLTPLLAVALLTVAAPASADVGDFARKLAAAPAKAAPLLGGCDVLVTPQGEVRTPCRLTLADLVGDRRGVTLTVTHVVASADLRTIDPPRQLFEYDVEATAGKARLATFHVFEIGFGVPYIKGDWSIYRQYWTQLLPDKAAAALAKAGKLPTPTFADELQPDPSPADDAAAQAIVDRQRGHGAEVIKAQLTAPGELSEALAAMIAAGAVVRGSAGERLEGKAGAKAVHAWRGLHQQGGVTIGGALGDPWAVTRVVGTAGGQPVSYVTFATYRQDATTTKPDPTKGNDPVPLLVIFGIAQ